MSRRIIACEVFKPYLDKLFEESGIETVDYLEIRQHDHPELLARSIQSIIDDTKDVDEILLFYGLCGNAILPLVSRGIPVKVLRVHDCAAALMGSNVAYRKRFEGNPHKRYHCLSYGERDDEYFARTSPEYRKISEEYGEDNADYVFAMLYDKFSTPVTYIKLGLDGEDAQIRRKEEGYYSVIDGNLDLLRKMLKGDDDHVGVTLYPEHKFVGVYDYEEILTTIKQHHDDEKTREE
ncbi:MAG: hypothetical protein A2Y20_07475 [Firmicutes bacterium GWF2_51_9]|nr:MAG: hypothetical protein A2Y20_07475 [Firmicutes bacterium GWF2_51_9]OGS59670.1 MAG: hypothetical protein A2Y19_01980 [Firmicutes bacterium GWE2_51_13]HBZ41565.1 hypothetical protein [Erysipelotrichaceae bacterium]